MANASASKSHRQSKDTEDPVAENSGPDSPCDNAGAAAAEKLDEATRHRRTELDRQGGGDCVRWGPSCQP